MTTKTKNEESKGIEDFYNSKSVDEWIKWAEREIEEYKKFIIFLKSK